MNTDEILALCARPVGLRVADLDISNASSLRVRTDGRLRELEAQGRVFKAKMSHKRVYWFTTKEAAERAMDTANAHRGRTYEAVSAAKPRMLDQGAELRYHPDFKGVQDLGGFVPRFQIGAPISFGLQRGRVVR